MAIIDTAMRVLHVLFAGLWTGGTFFMALGVLPAARRGTVDADAVDWIAGRFTYLTLASAGILFLTGGHLAGTLYTFETLLGTVRGYLVLAMLALWLVLAGILHFGTRKLRASADGDLESRIGASQRWFGVAGVVAVCLLVVAGLL